MFPKTFSIFIVLMWLAICDSFNQQTKRKNSTTTVNCNNPIKYDYCALNMIPLTNDFMIKRLSSSSSMQINDIDELCRKILLNEKCLRNYAENCMKSEARQTLSVMLYSVSRLNRKICSKQKRKQTTLTMMICLKKNPGFYQNILLKNLTETLYRISLEKRQKLKFPMICCNSYRMKESMIGEMIKNCPNNRQAQNELNIWIDSYSGDLFNLICGDYTEDSDKCETLPSIQSISTTTMMMIDNNKKLKWKSFIMVLVDLLNNLQ
ncbi:uncharacterized protein LOC113788821 [Dermatophagoides pteronyssinus]|uniref:uncharacterized protein LOC113788821 n=1 Tax=Dermatophagoides pteronyssinus TaxID=6956 RepID=UPI003F67B701